MVRSYRSQEFTIEFEQWGFWEFSRSELSIEYIGYDGSFQSFNNNEIFNTSTEWEEWLYKDSGVALIVDNYGEAVFRLCSKEGKIESLLQIERASEVDRGLCYEVFEAWSEGVVLCYELGIICFDKTGYSIKYHKLFDSILSYPAIKNDLIEYSENDEFIRLSLKTGELL